MGSSTRLTTLQFHAITELGDSSKKIAKSSERLASGLRINHFSDDPGGVAQADKLSVDNAVYSSAVRNVNDGLSAVNLAEAALIDLQTITTQLTEATTAAANIALSYEERDALNSEASALVSEFNRIVTTTRFNGVNLLQQSNAVSVQAGSGEAGEVNLTLANNLTRRTGTGTFQTASDLSVGSSRDIDTADANNDGYIDAITATASQVYYYSGTGSTLSAGTAVSHSVAPTSILQLEFTDVNNDGNPDIVALDSKASSEVRIYLGTGSGTFSTETSYTSGAASQTEMALADFNGDSYLDIVVNNPGASNVKLLLNNGNGTFAAATSVVASNTGYDIATGDFNNDSFTDLIITHNTNTFDFRAGNGDGTFLGSVTTSTGNNSREVVSFDYNQDGNLDLAINSTTAIYVEFRAGNGNGTFATATTTATTAFTDMTVGDFTGDGYYDLGYVDSGFISGVLVNNQNGTFTAASQGVVTNSSGIGVGDINGDGLDDFLMSSSGTSKLLLAATTSTVNTLPVLNLSYAESAQHSIDIVEQATTRVSIELNKVAATRSRLEFSLEFATSLAENLGFARETLTGIDAATEVSESIRLQILAQSQTAVFAQANLEASQVLHLIGGD